MRNGKDVAIATTITASPFILLMPLYLWMSSLHLPWGGAITGPATLIAVFIASRLAIRIVDRREAPGPGRPDKTLDCDWKRGG